MVRRPGAVGHGSRNEPALAGVRTALQDATSIAGPLITTEVGVAEAPRKKDAHAGHDHGGGMGM